MDYISPFTNKINTIIGIITALLAYIFGEHWILFLFFLLLNIGDFTTRWIAARLTRTESSQKCWVGILKKVGYWILIAVGFGMSVIFIEIGMVIGIDLKITTLLGWFVLGSLMINEIRSILENLIDIPGFEVPMVLVKGLEIVDKAIDGAIIFDNDDDNDNYQIRLPPNANSKDRIVLKVDTNGKKKE